MGSESSLTFSFYGDHWWHFLIRSLNFNTSIYEVLMKQRSAIIEANYHSMFLKGVNQTRCLLSIITFDIFTDMYSLGSSIECKLNI
jgi:hypothetical protein